MAEGRALGETGGAGGVLDVDGVLRAQAGLTGGQLLAGHLAGPGLQGRPRQETCRRLTGQADHATQLGQALAGQGTGVAIAQAGHQPEQHRVVIGGLEGIGADHPLAAGLAQGVVQLAAAVGRVDVDQDRADLGAGELGDAPLGAVGRPDAQAVTGLHAKGHEGPGVLVDRFGQLPPGVTQLLVADDQGLAVGEAGDGGVEGIADAVVEQGFVGVALGIAWLGHGYLLLFWST